MTSNQATQALCGLFVAGLLAGCGPALGTVSGNVTVDGQPLTKGVISFVPADGNGTPITAEIKEGNYTAQTAAGRKTVQISAPTVTGQRKEYNAADAPLVDITEESLPPKYNSESELTFDLNRGSQTKDWSVQSMRRR
jgi:hypothetical protein